MTARGALPARALVSRPGGPPPECFGSPPARSSRYVSARHSASTRRAMRKDSTPAGTPQ